MPELPEVEIVRRRLQDCLPGLVMSDIVVNDETVSEQSEEELRSLLAGRRVLGLRRRGKYLIVDFGPVRTSADRGGVVSPAVGTEFGAELGAEYGAELGAIAGADVESDCPTSALTSEGKVPQRGITSSPSTIAVIHLRMTGQLLFAPATPADRPPRFVWRFDPPAELHFRDVRRFGRLCAFGPAAEKAFFAGLGPEPFSPQFTVEYLRAAMAGRKAPLKSFLLDQRRLAGVGNIYADEALFRAKLHPLRAAGGVGPREALRLHAAILETLQAGIDHEGSSIESFIDPAGQRGSFQQILNVYQRTGEPCRVCGTPIRRIELGGRGTHFCPHCQPRRAGMVRRP